MADYSTKRIKSGSMNFVDRALVRYGHRMFGWTLVDKSNITEYERSYYNDDIIASEKKCYCFARPAGYTINPLFHLFELVNNLARFVRKIAFPLFAVLFVITNVMGGTEMLEYFAPVCLVFFGCLFLNIILPILGSIFGGSAAHRKQVTAQQKQAAQRSAQTRSAQENTRGKKQYAKAAAEKASRENREHLERQALINDYNKMADDLKNGRVNEDQVYYTLCAMKENARALGDDQKFFELERRIDAYVKANEAKYKNR